FIPASFSLVLALEAFVGERERTTLEVLLSTPLRETEIYAGKVAAVLAVSLGLCYGGLVVYCVAVFPGLGYFPLGVLFPLALLSSRWVHPSIAPSCGSAGAFGGAPASFVCCGSFASRSPLPHSVLWPAWVSASWLARRTPFRARSSSPRSPAC